ncbi:hypothetical protein PINS_up018445 [Pythium insidiosum]|nr:hypothetical protein PINS_up018445 [Pythium insidiosum]
MSLPSIRGLLARASMESPLGSSTPSVSADVPHLTRVGKPTWPVHPVPAPLAFLSRPPPLPIKTEHVGRSDSPSATSLAVVPRSQLHLDDPKELADSRDSLSSSSDGTLTPQEKQVLKRARRKEQCRVNQANYRKRKRAFELGLEAQLTRLREEIECLAKRREALLLRLVGSTAPSRTKRHRRSARADLPVLQELRVDSSTA